jgi:hypothetical protein
MPSRNCVEASGASRMSHFTPFLCLLVFVSSATAAGPASGQTQQTTSIGYPSPAAALMALRSKPGVKIREENDWVVVNDPGEHTFWSITAAGNPAHPAAVKRTLVEQDGAIRIQMNILCGAPKTSCDLMVNQFKEINEGLAKSLRK